MAEQLKEREIEAMELSAIRRRPGEYSGFCYDGRLKIMEA